MKTADLTKRARNVLQALNISTPSEMKALCNIRGHSPLLLVLREPNCGRKTASEILQWYESSVDDPMPRWVWVRMKRDDNLRWCIYGASTERQEGPDWHLADIATPTAQEVK